VKHEHFVEQIDEKKLLRAIAEAEAMTSGHLRVLVSKRHCRDALAAAEKHFRTLGLEKTPLRNGVLIFVAPRSHTFAIYGDWAVHERCGEVFWTQVRDEMTPLFKEGRYTEALLHGVKKAGQILAEHFPRSEPTGDK